MGEIVFVIHRAEEGGYWAAAEGHDIITEADNLDELERMIRDAVECHFDPGEPRPEVISWRFASHKVAVGPVAQASLLVIP